jgi:hypothetical protein
MVSIRKLEARIGEVIGAGSTAVTDEAIKSGLRNARVDDDGWWRPSTMN